MAPKARVKTKLPPSSPITFVSLPTPTLEAMSACLRQQLGPLLEQALEDGSDGLDLVECFALHAGDKHLYDLALFAGEDGAVYHAGTQEVVASFSQGQAWASDVSLQEALNQGDQVRRSAKKAAKKPEKRARQPVVVDEPITPPSGDIPEYSTIYAPNQFELGKKLNPRATFGLIKILKAPTPKELQTLTSYLQSRAPQFVVELAASVPLSVLEQLKGVRFVVLGPMRKSFEGLEALPASVSRLAIRKQSKLSLAGLPKDNRITSLELEVAAIASDSPSLAHLQTVGWTDAEDMSWLVKQPRLREVALRRAKVKVIPALSTLERLLLFKPSKLERLDGIGVLTKLQFLRIDQPSGMKRLGDLRGCVSLKTIALIGAHAIKDLTDLKSAPALEVLTVLMTKLGPEPFENLKGQLKGGGFQLKGNGDGKALLAHLGIPSVHTNLIENHFFDID